METHYAVCCLAVVGLVVSYNFIFPARRTTGLKTPPIIHLSDEALFRYPRQAYESALRQYGSVIGVYRKNR
ncbi:hypothetical protein E4T56_gene19908, partial [Termitomyces sp. T112]